MHKVMIVDDEPIFRDYMKSVLHWENHGFTVCGEARNGADALEKMEALRPEVLFVDINMPVMDGLSLVARIKEQCAGIQIVITSGHDEFDYARQAVRLGVVDYLLKPFGREELLQTVEKIKGELDHNRRNAPWENREPLPVNDGNNPISKAEVHLGKAVQYLDLHSADPDLTVESIAAAVYITPVYLRKIFRRQLNTSVMQYITHLRMHKAKQLIEKGGVRLGDIAFAVGYSDAGYFSRTFKKIYGMTPSAYENRLQG